MKKKDKTIAVIAIIAALLATYAVVSSKSEEKPAATEEINPYYEEDTTPAPKATAISVTNADGDMEIPIASVNENATFYSYDELDSKMEVIAVKASDGTIRTAFNTCQVCFNSGRGYYIQKGDILECQNCGNQFSMDDVEVTRNGCNPYPIYDEQTEIRGDSIIIPKEFLQESEVIFKNWKS